MSNHTNTPAARGAKHTAGGSVSKAPDPRARNSRKKIWIVLLIGLALAILIVGTVFLIRYLNGVRPIEPTKEEVRVVGVCGEYEIPYEEFRYVVLTYREVFKNTYGKQIWDTEESAALYLDELRDTVMSALRNNYAVLDLCKIYQIDYKNSAISDAVQELVEDTVKECGGKQAYREQLEQQNLTDHFFRFGLMVSLAENELYYQIRDYAGSVTLNSVTYPFFGDCENPNEFTKFYAEYLTQGNMIPVDYLYIQNDAGENPEDNLALAEAYRQELLALPSAERKAKLGSILGSDTNCAYTGVAPYFIVKGTYTEDFWNSISVLSDPGDVSEVICTENGYYVAVRIEYQESILLSSVQTLLKEYQSALVDALEQEQKDKLKVELNEYGMSLDLLAIQ